MCKPAMRDTRGFGLASGPVVAVILHSDIATGAKPDY